MRNLKTFLACFFVLATAITNSFAEDRQTTFLQDDLTRADSLIELGLITCGPGTEIYSYYGHTAIHYINRMDSVHPVDVVVNYGLFNMDVPYFALRFALGKTDYWMGICDFNDFCQTYIEEGRWVKEQKLNLSAQNKLEIAQAITENYLPQNRQYRYNYFYDNCTTRARDILLKQPSVKTSLENLAADTQFPSYRELIHIYNEDYRWARFANDILLGIKADRPTNTLQQQFLPERLMNDFNSIKIETDNNNGMRPLVSETVTWVLPQLSQPQNSKTGWYNSGNLPSPTTCFLLLLIATIIITALESYNHKIYWGYDAILMTLCGLSGILIFFMLFSEQPTVNSNLQLLLLNPLPLFFLPRMIKRTRKRIPDRQYRLWALLICLFFMGAIIQQYAEGMLILASSLLIRNIKRLS